MPEQVENKKKIDERQLKDTTRRVMQRIKLVKWSSPVHTAGCERGFSAQNLILTPLRNRLSGQNQDILLRVKLHFKDIDPFKAYTKWQQAKQRKN